VPKRVLHGEAMWSSTKLSCCPEWAIPEYSWLYPLADANGSFELTNLRVLWGKIAAIRPNFTLEILREVIQIFRDHGLLFTWAENGKVYGHWTGSDRPGRLPRPSRRKLERLLAPEVPKDQLAKYMQATDAKSVSSLTAQASLVLDLVLDLDLEKPLCANPPGPHESLAPPQPPAMEDKRSAHPDHDRAVERVWNYYLEKLGKNPKLLTFTPLRKQKGLARLRECLAKAGGDLAKAEALMKIAVDALAASDFHRGMNDRKKRYDSWERNLFPSQEKLEQWIEQE
jgi:hypothetical protein